MTEPASGGPPHLGELLERRISVERLAPYRRAVGGDVDEAADLYVWNAEVASAFSVVIGQFEVVLRNALHEQLTIRHAASGRPGQWYDDQITLPDSHRHKEVAKARQRLVQNRKVETPGRMVAELTFGFWRLLLDSRHQTTLWAQSLRHAFPYLQPQRRIDVYGPIDRSNSLRNRIAHHEPIHHLDLARRHQELLTVAGYIEPALLRYAMTRHAESGRRVGPVTSPA